MRAPAVSPVETPAGFQAFEREEVEQTIPSRFAKQVERFPERVAVKTTSAEITYRQLDRRANAVALELADGSAEPVAILLEHDAPLLAAILGTLKSARPYVPLDPTFPVARLEFLLEDSSASAVVADELTLPLARRLAGARRVVAMSAAEAADGPLPTARPETPAYVYYTSGSTGMPKGVVDVHRNVLHNVMRYTNTLKISPQDRLTLLQRPSFSGAVSSMFSALLNGAAVCPFDLATDGPTRLARWLAEAGVTIYHSVPSAFRQVASVGTALPQLRVVRLEGDRATGRDIELFERRLHSGCVLVNGLGATECGLVRQFFVAHGQGIPPGPVPIGYAVEDMDVVLLDEEGLEVAAGEIGEIAVRSHYLAPGYWQRHDLTAQRFRAAAEDGGPRTYLTGDLGRMQPDGCLEHLGRKDFQIKVRGNRVEVEMVEAALLRSGLVLEAAVTATRPDSDADAEPRIVAYVVSTTDSPPGVGALRAALAHLPASTRPAEFVLCDALPLGANGKVDPRALGSGPRARPLLSAELAPPRSHLEAELVAIWEELLRVGPIGVHDPFDELGGDSLLAATLLAGIEEKLCRELPFSLIAGNRTIEELARAIEGEAPPLDEPIVELAPRNGDLIPFLFAHGDYAGGGLYCARLARSLEPRGFYAIAPHGLHGGAVPTTVESMAVERVAALRELFPRGPYLLGGHCNPGGLLALEMARRLRADGELASLVLIATTPPNTRRGALPAARTVRAAVALAGRAARLHKEQEERLFGLAAGAANRIVELATGWQPTDPRPLAARNAWSRALGAYLVLRYSGPVALLWPEDDRFDADEAVRRWRRVGVEPETHVVPGDHLTVVTRHLGATAEALERALASSERQLRPT